MKRITQLQTLNAIQDTGGIMTLIATKLNCNWNTAKKYCNKWETTRQALKAETETTLDQAEIAIKNAIKSGDINTCKWYLSTKGKERGYTTEIQQNNIAGNENEPLKIIFEDSNGNELFNKDNVEINNGY